MFIKTLMKEVRKYLINGNYCRQQKYLQKRGLHFDISNAPSINVVRARYSMFSFSSSLQQHILN